MTRRSPRTEGKESLYTYFLRIRTMKAVPVTNHYQDPVLSRSPFSQVGFQT